MKVKTVTVPHNPAMLHGALVAEEVPVVTIRSDWGANATVCLCSVVIFDKGFNPDGDSRFQQVLEAHLNEPSIKDLPGNAPPGYDMSAALARMSVM